MHLSMIAVNGLVWQVIGDGGETVLAQARVPDFVRVRELHDTGSTDLPRPGSGL